MLKYPSLNQVEFIRDLFQALTLITKEEITVTTIPEDSVFGPGNINHNNASDSTQGEDGIDPARGQTVIIILQESSASSEASNLCECDNGSQTGNLSGSTVSPVRAGSDKQGGPIGYINRRSETELPAECGHLTNPEGVFTLQVDSWFPNK